MRTNCSNQNSFATRNVPRGLTLLEIMCSIMVLSIGLVGVLAAIPFGGFRLSQMNEADNSSLVGRDAARMIRINDWANPNNWYLKSNADVFWSNNVWSLMSNQNLNLTFPFLIDPLANITYQPTFYPPVNSATRPGVFYTSVAPIFGETNNSNLLAAVGLTPRYERAFYLPDDIANGYDSSEDETEFRPFLETEDDSILGGETPSFTGRYSWMAMVYLKAATEVFYDCPLSDVHAADYDVVVFKDRDFGNERFMPAVVEGTGYQGGTITLDLSGMVDNSSRDESDDISRNRVLEQLESTKCLALTGPDDVPTDGVLPNFTRWYRIANYSVADADASGAPTAIRVTLIGPDVPRSWLENGSNSGTVRAIFFPGAVSVFSGTAAF